MSEYHLCWLRCGYSAAQNSNFNTTVVWMQVMHGIQTSSRSADKQKIWERPARLTPNLPMHARDRFA